MKKSLAIGDKVSVSAPSVAHRGKGIIVDDGGQISCKPFFPGYVKLWHLKMDSGKEIRFVNEYWLEKIPSKIKLFEDD